MSTGDDQIRRHIFGRGRYLDSSSLAGHALLRGRGVIRLGHQLLPIPELHQSGRVHGTARLSLLALIPRLAEDFP